MFWTGTGNGMWSRVASRKVLITHLISHCTSSAPGGAPVRCVCVWDREGERAVRRRAAATSQQYGSHFSERKRRRERRKQRERATLFFSCRFFSPRAPPPTPSTIHCDFEGESSVINYMFSYLHLILLIQCCDWFLLSKHVPEVCVPAFMKSGSLLLLRELKLITFLCPPALDCSDR